MNKMKWVYYGFGAFIGFVCGVIVSLMFLAVERSGEPILSSLPKNYGTFGVYLLHLYDALPFFGVALGIIMVKIMFQKDFDKNDNDRESS